MRISLFFITALILAVSMPKIVWAQDIPACSAPTPAELNTDPGMGHYCDIYSRQLAYGTEDKKFQKLLLERQKNYGAIRTQAVKNYEANLAGYYKKTIPVKETDTESKTAERALEGTETPAPPGEAEEKMPENLLAPSQGNTGNP